MSKIHQYDPPITANKKRRIAEDFYNSELSIKYIAQKHKVTIPNAQRIAQSIDPVSCEKEKDIVVIKVESKWIMGIKHLLESRGIPHEIPENFELIEKFESKINSPGTITNL